MLIRESSARFVGTLPEHPLRKLLSGFLHREDPASVEIAYVHRGAPGDTVRISASEIRHVGKGSFLLPDGETQIPFHRILYIRDVKKGLLLWEKRHQERVSDRDH